MALFWKKAEEEKKGFDLSELITNRDAMFAGLDKRIKGKKTEEELRQEELERKWAEERKRRIENSQKIAKQIAAAVYDVFNLATSREGSLEKAGHGLEYSVKYLINEDGLKVTLVGDSIKVGDVYICEIKECLNRYGIEADLDSGAISIYSMTLKVKRDLIKEDMKTR